MVDIHLQELMWMYCPGHAGVKGNDRADRQAGKATITSGLCLGRSEEFTCHEHTNNIAIHLSSHSADHKLGSFSFGYTF